MGALLCEQALTTGVRWQIAQSTGAAFLGLLSTEFNFRKDFIATMNNCLQKIESGIALLHTGRLRPDCVVGVAAVSLCRPKIGPKLACSITLDISLTDLFYFINFLSEIFWAAFRAASHDHQAGHVASGACSGLFLRTNI